MRSPMRCAKSYSIVDHWLLHGGYFQKLSHQALSLYLFLIVVGDRNGRSFYADPTIEGILRLCPLDHARSELIRFGLIDYRQPYWWVKTLLPGEKTHERSHAKDSLSQRRPGAFVSSDPISIRDLAQEGLKALHKQFRGENDEKEIPA